MSQTTLPFDNEDQNIHGTPMTTDEHAVRQAVSDTTAETGPEPDNSDDNFVGDPQVTVAPVVAKSSLIADDEEEVSDVEVERKQRETTTKKKPAEGADLRVFANGDCYPSAGLVERFDMEYKDFANKHEGNCFHIFSAKQIGNKLSEETSATCIMVAIAKKGTPLFAGANHTKYVNESDVATAEAEGKDVPTLGAPKASALTQGSGHASIAKAVTDVFGKDAFGEKGYVDIVLGGTIKNPNKWTLMMTSERGQAKGKVSAKHYDSAECGIVMLKGAVATAISEDQE